MNELDHRNNLDLCLEANICNLWGQWDPAVMAGESAWVVSQALTSRLTNLIRSGLDLLYLTSYICFPKGTCQVMVLAFVNFAIYPYFSNLYISLIKQ